VPDQPDECNLAVCAFATAVAMPVACDRAECQPSQCPVHVFALNACGIWLAAAAAEAAAAAVAAVLSRGGCETSGKAGRGSGHTTSCGRQHAPAWMRKCMVMFSKSCRMRLLIKG
jgi:hypothetical protein